MGGRVVALHVLCPLGNFHFAKNVQILNFFNFFILKINTMSNLLSSLDKHVCLTLEHGARVCDCVCHLNILNMLKMHSLIA